MIVLVKLNLDELAESRGVIVSRRLRIADGFHDRQRGKNLLFHLSFGRGTTDSGEISHRILRRHGFPGPGFSGNDDGLIVTFPAQIYHATLLQIFNNTPPFIHLTAENSLRTFPISCKLPLRRRICGAPNRPSPAPCTPISCRSRRSAVRCKG